MKNKIISFLFVSISMSFCAFLFAAVRPLFVKYSIGFDGLSEMLLMLIAGAAIGLLLGILIDRGLSPKNLRKALLALVFCHFVLLAGLFYAKEKRKTEVNCLFKSKVSFIEDNR